MDANENERTRSSTKKRLFKHVRSIFSRKTVKQSTGYLNLLLRTGPSWQDYTLIFCGVIFAIAAGIPYPILGILFGELVDDLNSSTCDTSGAGTAAVESSVRRKVLLILYVTIANFFSIYLYTSCWSMAGERLVRRLRKRYFQSLLRQEAAYFDILSPSDVVTQLSGSINVIQSGTSEKVGIVISTISYFVTAYIVAFMKVSKIAGMLVSLVPMYFIMALGGGFLLKRFSGRATEHTTEATTLASSSLGHVPIVHAFGAHRRLEKFFSAILLQAEKDVLLKAFVISCQLGLLYFVAYSANALAFWQGSRMIADEVGGSGSGITVGAVYTVIFVLLDASFILSQVAPFIHIFSEAVVAAETLFKTINRWPVIDPTSSDGTTIVIPGVDDIELQDVCFSYPTSPETQVLRRVSMKIPSQKHTAIVGLSGSGKSTLAALLERFYDPSSGRLLVGCHDLREVNVRHLRGNIGLVQQEPTLFNRSILENIAFGLVGSSQRFEHVQSTLLSPTLSDAVERIRKGEAEQQMLDDARSSVAEIMSLVRQAAQRANALDFIESLPFGFATSVGPNGNSLSGGQRQRIALARALIRQPSLLLLDEATAALDHANEALIQAILNELSGTMTTVTIAHRLSTIRNADNIIVMSSGEPVEQGTHDDLIRQDGVYARLVRLQNLKPATVDPDGNDLGEKNAPGLVQHQEKEAPVGDQNRAYEMDYVEKDNFDRLSSSCSTTEQNAKELGFNSEKETSRDGDKKPSIAAVLRSSAILARPQLLFIVTGVITSFIIGGSYSGEAVIFGHTIGILNPCKSESAIRRGGELFSLLFFLLAILELCANIINGSSFGWVAQKLVYRVRILSFRSLLRQSIEWHGSDGRTPGSLVSYLTSDATALSALTGSILGIILSTIVNLFAGIILSHVLAWRIAVVLLPTLPVLLASGFMRLRVLAQFQERHQKAFADATSLTIEAVDQIRTISAFSLESPIYAAFRRSLKGPYEDTQRAIASSNAWLALSFSVSNLVYALAYWWGSRQILEGHATQTEFFIVLPALLLSTQTCGQLFALAPDLSKARIAGGNILRLLSSDPDPSISAIPISQRLKSDVRELWKAPTDAEEIATTLPSSTSLRIPAGQGSAVSFVSVNFSYAAARGKLVLDRLTISVPPSTFCAIVGPSGAGKSTIMSLLLSLHAPDSGTIFVDGTPVNPLHPTYLASTAYVPQSSSLLAGTVAFNVGLGAHPSHDATGEEIQEACKLAHIHETIMALPQGYDTKLQENGSNLSGGQRQRLAIARALVRKPRLLLLDESTSALDAESEAKFQMTLKEIRRTGVTVVAIAHRLSTIQNADRIFVLETGRVVDWGSHEELVRRCEIYQQGVIAQSLDV